MKKCLGFLLALVPAVAQAQEPSSCGSAGTCVANEDLDKFLALAAEKKCLLEEKPTFTLDPVRILVDRDGRVFYSGAEPNPYTLTMKWCGYEATAHGKVDVVAAVNVPSVWGFRFRLKAYFGGLPIEAFNLVQANATRPEGEPETPLRFSDVWDGGVLAEFFHYDWFNLNAAVGFRSFGVGVGFDLTSTVGIYAGYANTWASWHHNLNLAISVALW